MKIWILALAAALAVAQQPANLRNEAIALKAKGDAAGALSAFERAAVLEPAAPDLQDEIGFLLAVMGRHDEALQRFAAAIRLNPRYAPAHYHQGIAHRLRQDLPAAVAALREAVKLEPRNGEYRFRLASVLSDSGRDAEAITAAGSGDNRPDLWNLIGTLHQRNGDLKSARDAFQRALQLKPADTDYRNSLGLALVDLGMAREGLAHFQQILKQDPKNRTARINIGYGQLQAGDYDAALAQFQRLAAEFPDQAVIHYDLGLAFKQKDRLEDAKKSFREALRLDPEMVEAYYTLGITCWQSGDLEETAAAMRAAVARRPNYAEAHYMLGTALKQKGDLPAAAAALEFAIVLDPSTPGPYNTLAQIRQQQGDREAAKKLFAQAAEVKKKLDAAQAERLRTMGPATRSSPPRR